MPRALTAALLLLALSACSSGKTAPAADTAPATTVTDYDAAGHRATLEQIVTVDDWTVHQETIRQVCGNDEAEFAAFVAELANDRYLSALEVDVAYMCPDRLPELQAAKANLTPATPATTEPAEPAGIGPGVHAVGTDIQPGTYKTAGGDGRPCYWARLANLTGAEDIIANDLNDGPSTVEILDGDAAFKTSGCQPWTPTG